MLRLWQPHRSPNSAQESISHLSGLQKHRQAFLGGGSDGRIPGRKLECPSAGLLAVAALPASNAIKLRRSPSSGVLAALLVAAQLALVFPNVIISSYCDV